MSPVTRTAPSSSSSSVSSFSSVSIGGNRGRGDGPLAPPHETSDAMPNAAGAENSGSDGEDSEWKGSSGAGTDSSEDELPVSTSKQSHPSPKKGQKSGRKQGTGADTNRSNSKRRRSSNTSNNTTNNTTNNNNEPDPLPVDASEDPRPVPRFHPSEKGTNKQRRCDHDSDDHSYNGLGFDDWRKRAKPPPRSKAKRDASVDFDRQGVKVWGERLLFETLDPTEIDALVGWAAESAGGGNSGAGSETPPPRNPLLSLSGDPPLPPSHTSYVAGRLPQVHRGRWNGAAAAGDGKSPPAAVPALGDSAAVAVGICLEEALTASLLPLAGLHVLRCRALEAMEAADGSGLPPLGLSPTVAHPITGEAVRLDLARGIRWKTERAFGEWTLPPEEAILKLAEQGMLRRKGPHCSAPGTSRVPGREPSPAAGEEGPRRGGGGEDRDNESQSESESEDPLAVLEEHCGLKPGVLSANQEILDLFAERDPKRRRP